MNFVHIVAKYIFTSSAGCSETKLIENVPQVQPQVKEFTANNHQLGLISVERPHRLPPHPHYHRATIHLRSARRSALLQPLALNRQPH
jgi:hypothetical protein